MVKTRSQTSTIPIKKEEEDCKSTLLLINASNTSKNTSKITKRKASRSKINTVPVSRVKMEDKYKSKDLSKTPPENKKRLKVTEEQIRQLIHHVENENMTMSAASANVNIADSTGAKYYKKYKENPKQKVLVQPENRLTHPTATYTRQEIKKLIGYIAGDGMNMKEASLKANMPYTTAYCIYRRYLDDPNHKIPTSRNGLSTSANRCTPDQIKRLISHIVNDNMTVSMASAKANMSHTSGKKYYLRYLEGPNHNIPIPTPNRSGFNEPCTQKQISDLIGYIANDKMAIVVAAKKAGMAASTARRYYGRYLHNPNREIPTPHSRSSNINCTKQVRDMIGYLVNDNMSLTAASAKAKMSMYNARKYYDAYLNDPERRIPNVKPRSGKHYSQKQIQQAIRYIVDDKLSIRSAAIKSKMGVPAVRGHYMNYLKDPTIIKKE